MKKKKKIGSIKRQIFSPSGIQYEKILRTFWLSSRIVDKIRKVEKF